jgi:hypothetical protein
LAWAQGFAIDVVSSPPEYVTTPGVLVRVRGPAANPVGWASNDTLITPFYPNEDGEWFGWIGLMDLLKPDPVQYIYVVPDWRNPTSEIRLTISVHSPDQPVFAGPRPPAAPCQNEAIGFGPARDAQCSTGGAVGYVYRTTDGSWTHFPLGGIRPANIGHTTTSAGKDVPLIVRVETGVVNRAPYSIALLHDPGSGPDPSPGQPWPMTAWNGTLVYGAGMPAGACAGGEDLCRGPARKRLRDRHQQRHDWSGSVRHCRGRDTASCA